MSVAPSSEQQAVYNYFVVQAKALGLWDYIVDCGFFCAHDEQSSRLSVKNVITLTANGTITHHAGYGAQGNGTTGYFSTGYTFAGYQNDASLGVYCLSSFGEDASAMGNANSVIYPRSLSNQMFVRANSSSSGSATENDPIGLLLANRTGSAAGDCDGYKRETNVITSTGASATPDAGAIWILGRNNTSPEYSTRLISFWHIGRGIPSGLIDDYSGLVETVCAALSASTRVLATVTTKTRDLYRYVASASRKASYLLGAFDNTNWDLGTTPNLIDDIETLTTKTPTIITMEWADPDRSGDGATESAAQVQRIKDHYAAGGIVSLHHHPGNPVTGSFAQRPTLVGTTGNQYDMTGSPVLNCLSGGTERAEFLAYVDRLIAFLALCVDSNGNPIPIILRWWHEINGGWFWWTDAGTPANTVQLWKDFVDRIKDAGVQNVLFDFNRTIQTSPGTSFYPGDTYVDILSGDYYDDDSTTANVNGLSEALNNFSALRTNDIIKPLWIAEIGYRYAASAVADIWTTKTGYYHRDRYALSAGFGLWRSPYGPDTDDTNAANFQAMVSESNCLTLDRVSGIYASPIT